MVAPLPKSKPQPVAGQPSTGQTPPTPSSTPPETHAPDFNPQDQRAIQQVLDLFTNPDLSLRDIADQNNTTIHALTLWLARPEIAEQLIDLECASVRRARFNISFALPKIANALSQSLEQATTEAEHLDRLANNFPCFTLRLRYRENIRKSVAHLLRISGFDPTAKHRSETDRRRRDEQVARWRERCGLSMLDKHPPETPDPKSAAPSAPHSQFRAPSSPSPVPHSEFPAPRSENPQSEISNPNSPPPPAPHSAFPAQSSDYMLIAADEQGRTQIRGLTIPPELNKTGMPFTPVFDDSFDPSDVQVPSVPSSPSSAPQDDPETPDEDSPFNVSNFILATRVLAFQGVLTSDATKEEIARATFIVKDALDELEGEMGEDLDGLPLEQIVERVDEHLTEDHAHEPASSTSCSPPFASSA